VKGRECVFGMIENQEMVLNEYGKMAENIWKEIKNQFEFVELDQFIVMPNHIH
jgi:REP element-mobilizing transposase RayT